MLPVRTVPLLLLTTLAASCPSPEEDERTNPAQLWIALDGQHRLRLVPDEPNPF